MFKKVFKNSTVYLLGNLFNLIGGVISFPILTRILTINDYGIMSLISSTIIFVTAIAKFGLNKGVARFYYEFKSKDEKTFFSTFFFGGVFLAVAVFFVYICALFIIFSYTKNVVIRNLFFFTSGLILIRALQTIFLSFINGEQHSKLYSWVSVLQKYFSIFMSILLAYFFVNRIWGYYSGLIVSELLVLIYLTIIYSKRISMNSFNADFFLKALKYGVPLIAFEFAGILLTFGDRYVLQYYLGTESVGIYSAGYNISTYFSQLIIMPLVLTIYPMYMELWTNKGEKATKAFLSSMLKYFQILTIFLMLIMVLGAKDVVILLASKKFLTAYTIIPIILFGILINGAGNILGAGLYIKKRTKIFTFVVVMSGVINLALNFAFIPLMGILGAAWATLLAYLFSTILLTILSFKQVKIDLRVKEMIGFFMVSLLIWLIVRRVCFKVFLLNLVIRMTLTALLYWGYVVLVDNDLKKLIRKKLFRKRVDYYE